MLVKRTHWAVPGFTALALMALAACSTNGGGGGPGGTPPSQGTGGGTGGDDNAGDPPPPAFATPNPYTSHAEMDRPDKLDRLVVFGDSYSDPVDPKRSCANPANDPCLKEGEVWSNQLVDKAAPDAQLFSYARGKASAADTNVYYKSELDADGDGVDSNFNERDNTFKTQVDQAIADELPLTDNSLAVVYLGYNDANSGVSIQEAATDYEGQLERILAFAAPNDKRKVFVTLIHDWGSIPGSTSPFHTPRTENLNRKLSDLVNERDGVVAVDMFTVFERITADPERYGFTNVTTADAENSDDTALYFDDSHFGARGQEIIAEVYNHYLTRAWDWANSLAAGSQTVDRLNQDIDDGLVLSLQGEEGDDRLGLSTFLVGEPVAAEPAEADPAHGPSRAHFAALREERAQDGGIGIDYAFTPETRLGLVVGNYENESEGGFGAQSSRLTHESRATAFYLDTELGGLKLRTTATFSDEQHHRREFDSLIGDRRSASFGGRTTAITQKASLPTRISGGWLTPWADLTHSVQQVDGYTISNPYVSDLTFSDAEVAETWTGIGLDAQSDAFAIGEGMTLSFGGGVGYRRSLALDDYEVTISESALGNLGQTETIERDTVETVDFRVGAALAMGENTSLSTGYAYGKRLGTEAGHAATFRFNYRF